MKYYLKKCGSQELGSVDENGKTQRGRYLLTSKHEDILSMFPPLSVAQKNDSALLPIIPLYTGKKIYCNYVYHNDKYHGSTAAHPRDEYRIYLNRALENDQLYFTTDDIMVMRPEEILDDEGVSQTVYLMDLVKDKTSALYHELSRNINDFPAKGGHGLYDGTLDFFETQVEQKFSKNKEASVVIDNTVTNRISGTASIADLFNAATFRDFVMVGYDNLCAITGTVIRYENYMNLEAAHIKPKSHGGLFLPNNGIALNRDLHWAFDKGFFTLTDNLEVKVHPRTTSDYLKSFDGKQIRVPANPFFVPDRENIRYHRETVYGLFLTTGRL